MIYNCLLPLILAGARCAGIFNGKISRTIEARKGITARWAKKCAGLRRDGKLVWFHVSSAGEYLQAVPVIDLLLSREDPPSIAITFYSPSGFDYHAKHDRSGKGSRLSFVEYLPFDTRGNARLCLDSLEPGLIVYIRYDLWPNLVSEAHGRGIPQILLSGNAPRSLARRIDSRCGIRRGMYSAMASIGAVSDSDAKWFEEATGGRVPTENTGDIRFDQVIERVSRPGAPSAGIPRSEGARFIIAGSTWPRDEAIVIPGFRELLKGHPDARLVIAPHEPTGERVSGIMRALASQGLTYTCLSDPDGSRVPGKDVLIADGVGYLAELYGTGVLAYVGGGFTSGVHNILEPAVLGLPVLFGPRTDNAWEASCLVALGAASTVTSPGLFALEAGRFLGDGELLHAAGEAARKFVADHAGAARKAAALIDRFL